MLVSVIIVTHDDASVIRSCVESYFAQAGALTVEIIVIDNASCDDTVRTIRAADADARLIESPYNLGFAAACNIGLRLARGDYVLIANPDTIAPRHALERLVNRLSELPEVGLIGPKLIRSNGAMDLASRRHFPRVRDFYFRLWGIDRLLPTSRQLAFYNMTYCDPGEETRVECISGAFMLARRKAVEAVGELDERFFLYGEDLDWCYRFVLHGWSVLYCPAATVLHFKGVSSRRHRRATLVEFYRALHILFEKYYGATASPAVRLLTHAMLEVRLVVALTRVMHRRPGDALRRTEPPDTENRP